MITCHPILRANYFGFLVCAGGLQVGLCKKAWRECTHMNHGGGVKECHEGILCEILQVTPFAESTRLEQCTKSLRASEYSPPENVRPKYCSVGLGEKKSIKDNRAKGLAINK